MHYVNPHEVTALQIQELHPLVISNGLMSAPHKGAILLLSDGTSRKWVNEGGEELTPEVGDYFVRDEVLGVTCVVPQAKFAELFIVQK